MSGCKHATITTGRCSRCRQPRLTIVVEPDTVPVCVWVKLDGLAVKPFYGGFEPEARAAAQAYVDELKAHFREGGE